MTLINLNPQLNDILNVEEEYNDNIDDFEFNNNNNNILPNALL